MREGKKSQSAGEFLLAILSMIGRNSHRYTAARAVPGGNSRERVRIKVDATRSMRSGFCNSAARSGSRVVIAPPTGSFPMGPGFVGAHKGQRLHSKTPFGTLPGSTPRD